MNKGLEIFLGIILLVGAILLGWMSSAYQWTIFGKSLDFFHAAWILFKAEFSGLYSL